ncbi:MAG TPA: ECF-type sigma factor [Pyrinomonadaceae bacterium]|nr:ECF-type sigma factor [Pyrinomonadaceae bacterium]
MELAERNILTLFFDCCNLTLKRTNSRRFNYHSMSPDPNSAEKLLENRSDEDGNRDTLDALMPYVYEELHRQAHRYLRQERSNHTLQTTALINEVYMRLAVQNDARWQNRAQFFGVAANMMRRILVDYAKSRHRLKRGAGEEDLPIEEALTIAVDTQDNQRNIDLILLDNALTRLAEFDERQAKIVELRYFSGLTVPETAEVLNLNERTINREWKIAKAWLRREIISERS